MRILELFAGTKSIGKAFEARGHEVYSIDWDKDFEGVDLYTDISTLTAGDILERFGRPDVIWASRLTGRLGCCSGATATQLIFI